MATEQDWAAYADQAFLATGDTLLARTPAGAGVELPGSALFARRTAGGPFVAEGAAVLGNGPINAETAPTYAGVWFGFDGGANIATIQAMNASSAALAFYTKLGAGQASVERARIDADGRLLVGTTSPLGATSRHEFRATTSTVWPLTANGVDRGLLVRNSASSGFFAYFENSGGTNVGSISYSGSSTAYNTSSDYRLKQDRQPVENALARLLAVPVCNFAWKSTGARTDGFMAHELAEFVPEAVTGEKDEMQLVDVEVRPARASDVLGPDGSPVMIPAVTEKRLVPKYQGIDQAKLVPLLTAAVQELAATVERLAARVEELEAAR